MRERARSEFSFVDDLTINYDFLGAGYDRIFYYDAYPERKDSQSTQEYQTEYETKEGLFNTISRQRNFSVRTALTKNKARGKREQKGVDVLLAIDVLQHAMRGNIDEATVMTSDTDFFPLFEALLQTKTKSNLQYDAEKTSIDLINSVDFSEALTTEDFLLWHRDSRIQLGYNYVEQKKIETGREIASGLVAGKQIKIFEIDDQFSFVAQIEGSSSFIGTPTRTQLEGKIEKLYSTRIVFDKEEID